MNTPDRPARLVLVDDHPMVREGLRSRLSGVPGLQVVGEAGHPDEAEAVIRSLQPDLALLDVGLKTGNGCQLAERLLALQPGLRVLMYSMYDNPEYVQRALQAGASGYVLKDAPAGDVITAIDTVLSGGTYLSAGLTHRLFRNQQPKPVLTAREAEILQALGRGESSRQMAERFGLSVRTVETHRQSIKRKLGLEGQAELIRYAVEHTREA